MRRNRMFRKVASVVLTLALSAALALPAFAADSTVTFLNPIEMFEFEPGSYYTDTDLFENFKGVMPGDVLYEEVTVVNEWSRAVQIWMGGLLHDEEGNPISERVLEELIADDRKGDLSELEYMHDFLAQLTLTVWDGEMIDRNIIYRGSPNTLEEGFEDGFVSLGIFAPGSSITLNVRLDVPLTLGNEYAHRIGEVDWVFVIAEGVTPDPDPSYGPWPTPSPGVEPTPTPEPGVEPTPTPSKPPEDPGPQTGDDTVIWPFAALFAVGLIGMFITLFGKRKKDKEEE